MIGDYLKGLPSEKDIEFFKPFEYLIFMDEIDGHIENIVFCNEESGFTVARLKKPKEKELITLVGIMSSLQPGETVHCLGNWKYHPKHGRQFAVDQFTVSAPTNLLGIQKYLESGMVRGIGPIYAKRIVDHFGVKTLTIIDETPELLLEIEGIGEKRIEKIKSCWGEQKEIRKVMIFLQSHKISPLFARKIFKTYKEESLTKVQNNPYCLAKDIFRIGFKTADQLAQNLGIAINSPLRIQAGIEHVLWEMSHEGHVCYPFSQFLEKAQEILQVKTDDIEKQIETLQQEERIIYTFLENEKENTPFIWIRPLYLCEMGISREIHRLIKAQSNIRSVLIDKAIDWAEKKLYLHFAKEQKAAIEKSLIEKIHIITGGPGTGKSTITRAILAITSKLTSKIILAAPTGRAAKRLSEITSRKAFTIHSLLEFDFNEKGFKRHRDNPLNCHLLIVDEASMIDTQLMYHLLKAVPSKARIILIGDIDQLPSVGPGNVLKDMIKSKKLPLTRLKRIFRQGKGSQIIQSAHRINKGYFPDLNYDPNSDFIFFELEEPEEIVAKTTELIQSTLPKRFGFDPLSDIQVLTPMKRGPIGSDHFNHILQNVLNPNPTQVSWMGRIFRLNDKVMQIRNNYDKKVYNGDIGRIFSLDMENQKLTVLFDNKEVLYDFSELDELMLSYAVSVHKYQGSECPCILMPIHTAHFKLLFRNLLYTAITRGKKLVILLGTKKAMAIAIRTDNVLKRYSGLHQMLQNVLLQETTYAP